MSPGLFYTLVDPTLSILSYFSVQLQTCLTPLTYQPNFSKSWCLNVLMGEVWLVFSNSISNVKITEVGNLMEAEKLRY